MKFMIKIFPSSFNYIAEVKEIFATTAVTENVLQALFQTGQNIVMNEIFQ